MGLECTEDDMARLGEWTEGCTFAKTACIKAICQNFAFSCEQATTFLGMITFCGDDRLEILELFRDRLIDPDMDSDENPIPALWNGAFDDDERAQAKDLIKTFEACEVGQVDEFEVEDDGIRGEDAMSELLSALEGEGFSEGKLEVLEKDLANEPSPPPFTFEQLKAVLDKFGFSGDKEDALEFCTGPKLIYPVLCEEVVAMLAEISMSEDRLNVLRQIRPFIKDPQNKLHIVVNMTFAGDMAEAEEILRDVVVDFEYPEPPAPNIEFALTKIGVCSSGSPWVPTLCGWRCRAGGHYLSNLQIEAFLLENPFDGVEPETEKLEIEMEECEIEMPRNSEHERMVAEAEAEMGLAG